MSRKSMLLSGLSAIGLIVGLALLWKQPTDSRKSSASVPPPAANNNRDRTRPVRPPDPGGASGGSEAEVTVPGNPVSFSGDLAAVLGDESSLNGRARIELLRRREGAFTAKEVDGMLALLHEGRVPKGLRPEEWYWIVDELFSRMRAETGNPKALTKELADVFADTAVDPIVRDYALQHVGHLGREGGDTGVAHSAAMQGLGETGGPLAGTALLILHNEPDSVAGRNHAAGALAVELLNNEKASVPARVTAFQVAASHHAEGTLIAASEVLEGDAPVLLQVAAVAAVATVGTVRDLPLLQSLPVENPILQRAVHSAIQKLVNAS